MELEAYKRRIGGGGGNEKDIGPGGVRDEGGY